MSGLTGKLFFSEDSALRSVTIGAAAVSERNQRQVITELIVEHTTRPLRESRVLDWRDAQQLLATYPELTTLPSSISALIGLRPQIERFPRYLGSMPRGIGSDGQDAVQYLANAKAEGRNEIFDAINAWFETLGVQIDIELQGEIFETTASRGRGLRVNIADSGAGIAQILPLVVALKIVPPEDLPRLMIIEQPELDLHPHAHARVAELLVEAVKKNATLKLLIETHSDALVLRIRRELAGRRMSPDDVRLYFIEDSKDPGHGSIVKEIKLNDRGTPEWWPKGVFAESQAEFYTIRKELAKRDSTK